MNKKCVPEKKVTSDVLSTVFVDGMVVTSDDLNTAMQYPVALFQTLVRAYFGCGIVCGLEVNLHPNNGTPTHCLRIGAGVALDCHGYPLEVRDDVFLNFGEKCCDCGDWDGDEHEVYIAAMRYTEDEGARNDTDECDDCGKPKCNYGRKREGVRIAALLNDPKNPIKNLCEGPAVEESKGKCPCLTTWNPPCDSCEPSWVRLATCKVTVTKNKDAQAGCGEPPNTCTVKIEDRANFVRPIACISCPPKVDKPVPGKSDLEIVTEALATEAEEAKKEALEAEAKAQEVKKIADQNAKAAGEKLEEAKKHKREAKTEEEKAKAAKEFEDATNAVAKAEAVKMPADEAIKRISQASVAATEAAGFAQKAVIAAKDSAPANTQEKK